MPDPKLVHLMSVLLKKIRQQDVCALVILSSPTHIEHATHMESSWSHITMKDENGQTAVRIRIQRKDFKSDEEYHRAFNNAFGLINGNGDCLRMLEEQQTKLLLMLGKHLGSVSSHTIDETRQERERKKPEPLGKAKQGGPGHEFLAYKTAEGFEATIEQSVLGPDKLFLSQTHLKREQVRSMIAHLQAWLETGSIEIK